MNECYRLVLATLHVSRYRKDTSHEKTVVTDVRSQA